MALDLKPTNQSRTQLAQEALAMAKQHANEAVRDLLERMHEIAAQAAEIGTSAGGIYAEGVRTEAKGISDQITASAQRMQSTFEKTSK